MMKVPMTQIQLGIYLASIEPDEERNYDIPALYTLGKRSDSELKRLANAIWQTISACPAFQVHIAQGEDGLPCFETDGHPPAEIKIEDASSREDVMERLMQVSSDGRQRIKPLDLKQQLWDFRLFKTPEGVFFFCDIHHIISDGTSFQLFFDRLSKAYQTGEQPQSEPYSLLDVCRSDREVRASLEYEEELKWYMDHFAIDEMSRFPNAPRSEITLTDFTEDTFELEVPPEEVDAACTRYNVSKSTLFNAAFGWLLAAYNYSDTAAFGTTFHGRTDPRFSQTFAMMVRTLPVLVRIDGKMSIRDYLAAIQAQTSDVRRRSAVSTIDLNKKLGWKFNFLFTYQGSLTQPALNLDGTPLPFPDLRVQEGGVDFAVDVIKGADGFQLKIGYSRIAPGTQAVQAFVNHYRHVLLCLTEKENLSEIRMLSEAEEQDISRKSSGRRLEVDPSMTVAGIISRHAVEKPDALAVDDDTVTLTYGELECRANILADRLLSLAIGRDDFVGILLERGASFPVCTLAVHKAGAAYLPLDAEYPAERLQYMAENAQIKALITTRELMKKTGLSAENCLFLEEMDFDGNPARIDRSVPGGAAYIIYTSGSTGLPKGVVLHHAGLYNLCAGLIEILELTESHRIASHSSFSFDAHVDEVYPILAAGGSLHIMPSGIRKDMDSIIDFLKRHQIDGADFTTSLGMLLARRKDLEMKFMTFGGEKLSGLVSSTIQYFNEYGPTESTDIACIYKMEQGRKYDDIPIGEPMPNLWCFVLDRFGNLLPPGIPGELCVAGIQVGYGYWRLPEQTAKVFGACPFVSQDSQGRRIQMYHTGDLAIRGDDGLLYCIGRIDSQIKLNGFRVEPGEIENQVMDIEGISDAAVKVIKGAGGAHLALYYVVSDGAALDRKALKKALEKTSLPGYMIPELYMQMDALPRTPSGKVDRKNLPTPEMQEEAEIVPPTSYKEHILCMIVKEILGTDRFGVQTDLTAMGLTSLDALTLVASAEEAGIKLKVSDVTKYKTIEGILRHTMNMCYWAGGQYDSGKPVLVFPYGLCTVKSMVPLVTELSKAFSVLVIEPIVDHYYYIFEGENLQNALDFYLDLLELKIPEGVPVFGFIGHSYGGELAYKLAVQWGERRGEKPHAYVLDSAINQTDGRDYEQYVKDTLAYLADKPELLAFYQMAHRVTDIPKMIGDGKPYPAYEGPVTFFCATHITDELDYYSQNVLAVKTEDHPYAISWRKLIPHVEIIFVPTAHTQMTEEPWLPLLMEPILRDLAKYR